ncbi:response regulator [Pedobacter gandavensis]|uniref:response regulator n=1 Tax=Pedobacter TaxID=84567 RepID=UPI0007059BF2|nr:MULTISPECIES: response regulator [Pedobacter]ALL07882.1 transcriptional regulator [Pedobacter sp. PACM 27299]MBC8984854.1 response regulator [Pedobacter sp. N36a]WGQ08679.1 response regulator [Pedobacter gandavensis]
MKKFYLIDDDTIFVFLTRKTLQVANLSTDLTVFEDGKKALLDLELSANQPELLPDVIFLDLNMPVLDGWGFLEEYSLLEPKMSKKIEIYIVSSSISPSELERSQRIPVVTDFLTKPLSRSKFVEIFDGAEV